MNPQDVFCPNIDCPARGQRGEGNISIHSWQEKRYLCSVCDETFTATKGTIFYRLRTDPMIVLCVITLLVYGCPLQAIVKAFALDERTVKTWWQRAGVHCRAVHEHTVGQSQLDLQQVQADEIKVKAQGTSYWMALVMMVPSRLWLGGAISPNRDKFLIQQLADQVRTVGTLPSSADRCRRSAQLCERLSQGLPFCTASSRRSWTSSLDPLARHSHCPGRQATDSRRSQD